MSSSSKSLLEWLRLAEPLQSKVWLAVLMTYGFLLTLICVAALDSCSLAYVSGPWGKLYMGKLYIWVSEFRPSKGNRNMTTAQRLKRFRLDFLVSTCAGTYFVHIE